MLQPKVEPRYPTEKPRGMPQTKPTPPEQAAQAAPAQAEPMEAEPIQAEAGEAIHPADVLLNLIVIILAPIFLDASGGSIAFARMAALETVIAYRARHNADLIAIAQIIAFGLAALGSLSLSMADDISLSMTLRLRGNANALNRSAEQNRRALRQARPKLTDPDQIDPDQIDPDQTDPDQTGPYQTQPDQTRPSTAARQHAEPADLICEAAGEPKVVGQVTAHVADPVTAQAAALQPATAAPQPAPKSAPPTTPSPAQPIEERERQAIWATAMANVAAQVTASLPNLPPTERRAASIRAAALSSTASDLLSGNVPPRLRPGALSGLIPPKAASPPHQPPIRST